MGRSRQHRQRGRRLRTQKKEEKKEKAEKQDTDQEDQEVEEPTGASQPHDLHGPPLSFALDMSEDDSSKWWPCSEAGNEHSKPPRSLIRVALGCGLDKSGPVTLESPLVGEVAGGSQRHWPQLEEAATIVSLQQGGARDGHCARPDMRTCSVSPGVPARLAVAGQALRPEKTEPEIKAKIVGGLEHSKPPRSPTWVAVGCGLGKPGPVTLQSPQVGEVAGNQEDNKFDEAAVPEGTSFGEDVVKDEVAKRRSTSAREEEA